MSYFDNFGQDYISAMNNTIAATPVRGTSFVSLPEGKYQMFVDAIEIRDSLYAGGAPVFQVKLTVVDGEFRGKSVFKRYPLEPDERHIGILKTDLSVLGMDLTEIIDLTNQKKMEQLLDVIVDVTVKNKVSKTNGKSYPNYYLNKAVGRMGDQWREMDVEDTPWGGQ